MSVANAPGHHAVDPHVGAYSWAKAMVSALSPFFEAAYIASGGLGRTAPMLEMLMIEPAAGGRHPGTGHGHQPERALEVDLDGLVEQRLRHRPARLGAAGRCRRC